jgi:DNA-binding response OmpR family regulator
MNKTILLVEDNRHVLKINRKALTMRGYQVLEAETVKEGRILFEQEKPDMIILDIMLPDGTGLSLCEELRGTSGVPILFLTALGQEQEIIEGLKAGGDDYLPKTYGIDVLLARVEALLKRAERVPETIIKGGLTIIVPSGEVFVNGEKHRLSQNEFLLLLHFIQNENRIMSGSYLYEKIWGQPIVGDNSAIRNTIYRLRKILHNTGFVIFSESKGVYCFAKE